jgi:hypothetical protein
MVDTRQRILCRVPPIWHPAKFILKIKKNFAECQITGTRQRRRIYFARAILPPFSALALKICRARRRLPALPPPPCAVAGSPPHRGLLHAAATLAGARTRRALPRRRPSPHRRPPVRPPRPCRRLPARRRALALSLSHAAAAVAPTTPSADHARPLRPRPRPTASVPLARPRAPSTPSAAARPLRRRARAAVLAPLAVPPPPTPRATTAAGSHLLARRHRLPATPSVPSSPPREV